MAFSILIGHNIGFSRHADQHREVFCTLIFTRKRSWMSDHLFEVMAITFPSKCVVRKASGLINTFCPFQDMNDIFFIDFGTNDRGAARKMKTGSLAVMTFTDFAITANDGGIFRCYQSQIGLSGLSFFQGGFGNGQIRDDLS